MNKIIKQEIEKLSNLVLKNTGVYRDYEPEDLINALIILNEPLLALTYKKHKDNLTQKQMEELAEELGKSLRQTVELFTGVDMRKVLTK